jgi:hypothetical protein
VDQGELVQRSIRGHARSIASAVTNPREDRRDRPST